MPRTGTAAKSHLANSEGNRTPTPLESALYTHDLLISLKKLASAQGCGRLASLIGMAALEAETVARDSRRAASS